MPEFLQLLPPQDALDKLLVALKQSLDDSRTFEEEIDLRQALGRVTVEATLAPHPLPSFPRSTVDGYAVRAADTYGASDGLPATATSPLPFLTSPFSLLPSPFCHCYCHCLLFTVYCSLLTAHCSLLTATSSSIYLKSPPVSCQLL